VRQEESKLQAIRAGLLGGAAQGSSVPPAQREMFILRRMTSTFAIKPEGWAFYNYGRRLREKLGLSRGFARSGKLLDGDREPRRLFMLTDKGAFYLRDTARPVWTEVAVIFRTRMSHAGRGHNRKLLLPEKSSYNDDIHNECEVGSTLTSKTESGAAHGT